MPDGTTSTSVTRATRNVVAFLTFTIGIMMYPIMLRADASGPDFFRVSGVAQDDVLNIRQGPGAEHPKIGAIPADADGVRNLGCVGGLSFAEWENASAQQREAAAHTRWCRVSHVGVEGWVAGRYLAEGNAPAMPTEEAGFAWRLVSTTAGPVVGDAWIRFEAGGGMSGNTGCNNFRGTAVVSPGTISFPQPIAATKMFCTDPGSMEQEDAIFAALVEATRYEVDLLTGQLVISGQSGAGRLVYAARQP